MVYNCCVRGCTTRDGEDIVLRKFPPIDSPLFEQWKEATLNDSLKNMDNRYIRNRKKVCNIHFADNYRRRPYFLKYDFPKLTRNTVINRTHCRTAEVLEKMSDDSNKLIDNKLVNLDHSYCRTVEADVKEMNIVNSTGITGNKLDNFKLEVKNDEINIIDNINGITNNKLVNLDQPYSKTIEVINEKKNIVVNSIGITDNKLANLKLELKNEEMNIVDNSNRITDNKVVNLDQSHSKTVEVMNEKNNNVVNITRITNNKVVNLDQSYGKTGVQNDKKNIVVNNNNRISGKKIVYLDKSYFKTGEVKKERKKIVNNDIIIGKKVVYLHQSHLKTGEVKKERKKIVNNDIIVGKKVVYLHQSHLKTGEVKKERKKIVNNDIIVGKKVVYLHQSHLKTGEVKKERKKIVNNDIIVGKKVVYLHQSHLKTGEAKNGKNNIIVNNNGKNVVNLDQSYRKTEGVKDEKMNIVDDSNKLANFYQSYSQTLEAEAEDMEVDTMNSHITSVEQINKNKHGNQRNKMNRRQMQRRLLYLEKLKEKHKREMKEFGNFKKLDSYVQNFFKSQLCNIGRKSKGEYYTFEDKVFAYGIFNQSRACYKYLSHFFTLPSLGTIMRFHNNVRDDSALKDKIFNLLKQHISQNSGIEEMHFTSQNQENMEHE